MEPTADITALIQNAYSNDETATETENSWFGMEISTHDLKQKQQMGNGFAENSWFSVTETWRWWPWNRLGNPVENDIFWIIACHVSFLLIKRQQSKFITKTSQQIDFSIHWWKRITLKCMEVINGAILTVSVHSSRFLKIKPSLR